MSTKELALEALRRKQGKLKEREETLIAQGELSGIGMMGTAILSKFVEILIPIVESGREFHIPEEAQESSAIGMMELFKEDVEAVLQGYPPQVPYEEEFQTALDYFVHLKRS
jgi:hypothetical protein